ATNVDAVAVPMASDCRLRVIELLDCDHEFVAMCRIGGVEVKRCRVTQVALGDETTENDELVPWPSLMSEGRKASRRGNVVALLEVPECAPALDRHERMLCSRRDLTTKHGTEAVNHPLSARTRLEYASRT